MDLESEINFKQQQTTTIGVWVEWNFSTLKYRYTVSRSVPKKWYLCIVFYLFDLTCVEAWLLYRRDCVKSGVTNEMPLLECKSELAQCLPVAPMKRKVGRHPSSDAEMQLEAKRHRGPTAAVPPVHHSLFA